MTNIKDSKAVTALEDQQEEIGRLEYDFKEVYDRMTYFKKQVDQLTQELAVNERIRVDWFDRGRKATLRCNKECACTFDEMGELDQVCGAHRSMLDQKATDDIRELTQQRNQMQKLLEDITKIMGQPCTDNTCVGCEYEMKAVLKLVQEFLQDTTEDQSNG